MAKKKIGYTYRSDEERVWGEKWSTKKEKEDLIRRIQLFFLVFFCSCTTFLSLIIILLGKNNCESS